MRSKYSKQEKFDMIMDCRQSGLSDYQWCKRNGISTSTFYGWSQQLRKSGFDLPDPSDRDSFIPTPKQDIVKLEVVDNISVPIDVGPIRNTFSDNAISVEIEIGQAKIKISNDINPALLTQIMSGLGGGL